jgi:protein-tyrosine-phosphatase
MSRQKTDCSHDASRDSHDLDGRADHGGRCSVKVRTVPPRLLFVCVENSNRSQMAEAFARMHGGDAVEVYSAGSQPSGKVNLRAIDAMRERGYDLTAHRSKSLNEIPAVEYEHVVTMGCGDACPWIAARHREDWDLPDPKNLSAPEVARVRDEIERRVVDLLQRVRSESERSSR